MLQVPSLLFEERTSRATCSMVEPDQPLSDALDAMQFVAALIVIRASSCCSSRRWRAAARRRSAARSRPVLWTGGAAFAVFAVAKGFDAAGATSATRSTGLALALVATVPFGFLVGLLRSRLAQGAAVAS